MLPIISKDFNKLKDFLHKLERFEIFQLLKDFQKVLSNSTGCSSSCSCHRSCIVTHDLFHLYQSLRWILLLHLGKSSWSWLVLPMVSSSPLSNPIRQQMAISVRTPCQEFTPCIQTHSWILTSNESFLSITQFTKFTLSSVLSCL